MDKVCIFIDGANFYHLALKKLGIEETHFDYDAFATFLANGKTIAPMGKRYYTGTVREKVGDDRSKHAMARQTSLLTTLKKAGWEIKTSKLKTRIEEIVIDSRVADYQKILKLGIKSIKVERQREKGVDVKLATDIIVGAVDNKYGTAIVVSSDSDLIPAIDWVRLRKKKKVEYVGFSIPDELHPEKSTNPLISLITKTDIKRVLVESDLWKFISFKSFNEDEFKIISAKPCIKKYLFHSSGKSLTTLDPKRNRKLEAYGSVHEYGLPVVYASDKPSNAFCYEPTDKYAKTREQHGTSVYHRLTQENHKILLGANLKGYIYVLSGNDFLEVTREDFENGKWVRSVEWVSPHKVVPVEAIEITKPYDWEMLPEYEFLGTKHVGEMSAEEYLSLAKDESVKKAVRACVEKPFAPSTPEALKKYL